MNSTNNSIPPDRNKSQHLKLDVPLLLQVAMAAIEEVGSRFEKQVCRNSVLTGREYMRELLDEGTNKRRFAEIFRISRDCCLKLCDWLKEEGGLRETIEVKIEEQVGMFLWTVARGASNRDVQERFQHSGDTVSRYVLF